MLALTRVGERPLVPGFGLTDPAFATFEPSELAAAVTLWGPRVVLDRIDVSAVDDSTIAVEVGYR